MVQNREIIFQARRFDVARIGYSAPDGRIHTHEVVVHPGAVTILPLLEGERVCLIRNYRAAVDRTLVELPAGTLEPGEDPAAAAARELIEETGYRAEKITRLCRFWMSPGILDECMHLYLATKLEEGVAALEPGEQIEPFVVDLAEALAMAADGRIEDAKTLVGLFYYEQMRSKK